MAPAQRRFYQSAKTKKCDPSHSLFAGPAPTVGGEEARQESDMQRPLTLALVLAGVFFFGMIVGYTHVQPWQLEASQPLRQPRG